MTLAAQLKAYVQQASSTDPAYIIPQGLTRIAGECMKLQSEVEKRFEASCKAAQAGDESTVSAFDDYCDNDFSD